MEWQSESDTLNMNDDHHSRNKTSDAVGKGLYTMLACGMRDFDSKAHQTLDSQHHLLSALDRLTQELDQLLEDAPLPFIMQHAAKISGVRKRVSYLNSLLTSIQHRLDNMDQLLSAQAELEFASSFPLWLSSSSAPGWQESIGIHSHFHVGVEHARKKEAVSTWLFSNDKGNERNWIEISSVMNQFVVEHYPRLVHSLE